MVGVSSNANSDSPTGKVVGLVCASTGNGTSRSETVSTTSLPPSTPSASLQYTLYPYKQSVLELPPGPQPIPPPPPLPPYNMQLLISPAGGAC